MIPPEWQDRLSSDGSFTVAVRVIPNASRSEIAGLQPDGSLKVRVTAAPEKGRANAAVCELLARAFHVSTGNVAVMRGQTSQNKQVRILR